MYTYKYMYTFMYLYTTNNTTNKLINGGMNNIFVVKCVKTLKQ